jgi:thiamine biosynthesis lipoprotein
MHQRLTRFDARSELSRLNSAAGRWCDISPALQDLLRAALWAHELSGGLVNVAVLPQLRAAGYRRSVGDGAAQPAWPVLALPDVLELRSRSARLRVDAAVDLGGIAKGWMADRLAARLGDAVVNLGGDLRACGSMPGERGWPVGFGDTTLMLREQGAATSGTWLRRWGMASHHIIDPRTGAPARTNLREVSVVATTALRAEVLAKTALILGREKAELALLRGGALAQHLRAA